MSSDILDLIDSTLDDVTVSGDAMRWAPDAPDPTPPPGGAFQVRCDDAPRDITTHAAPWLPAEVWDRCIIDEANTWLAHHGYPLTDWQYELVSRMFKVPVRMLLSRAEVERRARLRRMHSEYRRRTRRSVHR